MAEPTPIARVLDRRARADYGGAREEALRALDELDSKPDASSRDLFEMLVELGRLQQDCGEAADAEATFERALAVGGDEALRARALARLSAVYRDQGRFDEAERAAHDAIELAPEESLEAADALVELASEQFAVTKYDAAEESCLRAFPLAENAPPGVERDRVRTRAHATLGTLHRARGRYADAEQVLRQTIELAEQSFGPDSLEAADALNDLAIVFKYAGRFDDAEPLYRRALDINVRAVGEIHYNVASIYHNLGGLEHARGNHAQAEPHARRSVEIRRQAVGPDHPSTAADEAALASILYELRKDEEAERLLRSAISTYETVYGGEHYELSVHLNNLAAILQRRKAYTEAEALYRRALAMKEKLIGPEHPVLANTLNNLAVICRRDERYDEAERLYERALELLEAGVEPGHPTLARTRRNYAALLRATGRDDSLVGEQPLANEVHDGPVVAAEKIVAGGGHAGDRGLRNLLLESADRIDAQLPQRLVAERGHEQKGHRAFPKRGIDRCHGFADEPSPHRGRNVCSRGNRLAIEVANVLEIDVAALQKDDRPDALRAPSGEVAADRRAPREADELSGLDGKLVEQAGEQPDETRGDIRLRLEVRRAAVPGDVRGDDAPNVPERLR